MNNFSDLIQLVSVMIAAFAAILSSITVCQQKKHYTTIIEEHQIKYKPILRIDFFDFGNDRKMLFDVKNEGFQYFIPNEVIWIGTRPVECEYIKGTIKTTNTSSKGVVEKEEETLAIFLNIPENLNDKGKFIIKGYDIFGELISFKSPELIFNKGKLENHLQVSKQYLS